MHCDYVTGIPLTIQLQLVQTAESVVPGNDFLDVLVDVDRLGMIHFRKPGGIVG